MHERVESAYYERFPKVTKSYYKSVYNFTLHRFLGNTFLNSLRDNVFFRIIAWFTAKAEI